MAQLHPFFASEGRFRILLAACGLGIGIYCAGALLLPPGVDLVRHVLLFLVTFSFYVGAVILIVASEGRFALSGRVLALALVWALLLRVVLLSTTPSLSDDLLRYVWDGKVATAGFDPYAFPPSAPELSHLRGPLWEGVNHKDMPTPYPPLSQVLFALTYRLAPDSLTAMQLLAVGFDLGVIAILALLLRCAGLPVGRVLIYAWNPLLLVQYAHSGHFDAAMVFPLLASLYFLASNRRVASGLLLGASILVKLLPALVAPLFLPLWGVVGLLSAAGVVAMGTVPLLDGTALAGILSEASDARFNDSGGYLLVRAFGLVSEQPEPLARAAALLALVLAATVLAIHLWRTRAPWQGVLHRSYWLFGLYLLLNPVVEPWYLAWIIPFLCFTLSVGRGGLPDLSPSWGWLLLSGLVILTDLTYAPGATGSTWVWVRAIEYSPLYLLLALWVWRRRARLLPRRAVRPGWQGPTAS